MTTTPGQLRRHLPRPLAARLHRVRSKLVGGRPYLASPSLRRSTRLKLVAVTAFVALPGTRHRDVRLRLRRGGEVYLRTDTIDIDILTLDDAMTRRYFPGDVRDRVVLDLGAHKGYVAAACLHDGCRAVYSLEPESDNFRCLRKATVDAVTGGRWVRARQAIGPANGRAQLQVSSESWSHSMYTPASGTVLRTEEVEVVAFGALLEHVERQHPGSELVVKLNIEGMAGDCLLSVEPERLHRVRHLFVDLEANTPQSLEQLVAHAARAGLEVQGELQNVWHFTRSGDALHPPGRAGGSVTGG